MQKISNSEKELMSILWKLEKAFLKDLIEMYPHPKPANTTIATFLKRLKNKEFINYKTFANSREYFPLITKEKFVELEIYKIIDLFYDQSAINFLIMIVENYNLTQVELYNLLGVIKLQLKLIVKE